MNKQKISEKELDQLIDGLSKKAIAPPARFSADESYAKFKRQLPENRRMSPFIKYAIAAAAVFIAVVSGIGIYHYASQPDIITVTTTSQIKEVSLPDGSHVTLSHYSTLSYHASLKGSVRTVNLIGEAYFEVVKDKTRPFIVQVEELSVKVLGTQFNVQAYPENTAVKTTLLEGAVEVIQRDGKNRILLSPNESAVYDKAIAFIQKRLTPDAADEISWIKGIFIFKETPLAEIVQKLNNHYNVNFQIANEPLKSYKLSATFEKGETLDEILHLLQQAANFHIEGNVISANK